MTAKQLIEKLEKVNPNSEVIIYGYIWQDDEIDAPHYPDGTMELPDLADNMNVAVFKHVPKEEQRNVFIGVSEDHRVKNRLMNDTLMEL